MVSSRTKDPVKKTSDVNLSCWPSSLLLMQSEMSHRGDETVKSKIKFLNKFFLRLLPTRTNGWVCLLSLCWFLVWFWDVLQQIAEAFYCLTERKPRRLRLSLVFLLTLIATTTVLWIKVYETKWTSLHTFLPVSVSPRRSDGLGVHEANVLQELLNIWPSTGKGHFLQMRNL